MNRRLSNVLGNMKDATNGGRNPISFAEVAGTRALKGAAYTALFAKTDGWNPLGKPDVILGFLPMYGVQYAEVARSQDTLEYRSIGAEFLGHQKGGNLGIRIDCILDGPEQTTIANTLWWLHLMGREEHDTNQNLSPAFTETDMAFVSIEEQIKTVFSNTVTTDIPIQVIKIENEEELYMQMENDSSLHVTTPDDMKNDRTAWHKTFTLVTKNELIFDCFIETIVFSRDYKEGAKVLKCTILLRQFIPPEYKLDERLALQATVGTNLAHIKDRKDLTPADWRNLKVVKVQTLQSPIGKSNSKFKMFQSLEKVDFMLNVAYRTALTATNLISNIQRQKIYNPLHDPIGRFMYMLGLPKVEKREDTDNAE